MAIDIDMVQLNLDTDKLAENHGFILSDDAKKQLFVMVSNFLADQPSQTVYVVTWRPMGVGGFNWFWKREDAERNLLTWAEEDNAELQPVQIPADFTKADAVMGGSGDADEITDWIDTWWYAR